MEIIFRNPHILWALLIIPIIIVIHFASLRYSKKRAVKFANFVALARVSEKIGISSNYLVLSLRILVFAFAIFAIAGASLNYEGKILEADYVIAIDSSASMLAEDLAPNRLEVAKNTATKFVDNLNPIYSSISIISFSGTPLVHQVLTKNKAQLNDAISEIAPRAIGGTDLGNALVTASNLLVSSDKPKIIILITDGRDNIGLDYRYGANYANDNNILVFTMGIGTQGFIDSNQNSLGPLGIDSEQLIEIVELTGGEYFHILTPEDLTRAYESILQKERKKISLDLNLFLLIIILFLLTLEWVLINTRFRILP